MPACFFTGARDYLRLVGAGDALQRRYVVLQQIEIKHVTDDNAEYRAFVDKFKPKLTTDDCYTPPEVYDAVADWTAKTYGLDKTDFVRPFFPGGDYEHYPYPNECVVVDNPPFSIISQIVGTYIRRGIRFLLFCPGVTGLCKGAETREATILAAGAAVIYENGASVNTSFVTNLETEYIVRSCPDLRDAVEQAVAVAESKKKKHIPKYAYPAHVVSLAMVNYMSAHNTFFGVRRGEAIRIGALDEQKKNGKTIFGGGLLLCDQAAEAKAAAEKAQATVWSLSDREREIVRAMNCQVEEN